MADVSAPLGMATTRYEDRSVGAGNASVRFEAHQGLCGAGVLFLLPSLLAEGLLKSKEVYHMPESHYYGLESVLLTLAFMALARIKNPEQLKQCKPGEIGKIIGLDRIPEVRCLRDKIKLLTNQQQASKFNRLLIDHWYEEPSEESGFLYIDGHVRIYYGHKANLPAKFVSRQKLCLSATTEYWVNDARGLPVMMVMGELTEKLQQAIEARIIPQLQQTVLLDSTPADQVVTSSVPACTLVFDREAYAPAFFMRLWENHRIAIITYRKNVHDIWPEESFKSTVVQVLDQAVTMHLCENQTTLGGVELREIRRRSDNGHQTAIITNNQQISMETVAGRMFGRWSQENFFRYLIMDYDFDKMIEYGIEAVDDQREVVNPAYRKLTHQLKKAKEKLQRLKAKLYPIIEQGVEVSLDQMPSLTAKQQTLYEKIKEQQQAQTLIEQQRVKVTARIKLADMPNQVRYNKLKQESKMLINIIKMICYRAETAVASILASFMPNVNAGNQKRMLVKQIIENNADLIPDFENKTLTIILHTLSAARFNNAATQLAQMLTETETIFPGSNLKMIFKTTANPFCEK